MKTVAEQAVSAFEELIEAAGLTKGQILVVGCSSSELVGETLGHGSNFEVATELFEAIYPILQKKEIYLAAQCCEHLNRALIVERKCAEQYGLEPVCVVPYPKAGGSFATAAWRHFEAPVVVEHIRAHAGIDIGGVMVGMHLREVAVPLRISVKKIGEANILCAKTRPKLIGGERAKYE